MIYLLNSRATKRQIEEMLQTLETYIKLAVDVEFGIVVDGDRAERRRLHHGGAFGGERVTERVAAADR